MLFTLTASIGPIQAQSGGSVRLKSREFVPAAGVEQEVQRQQQAASPDERFHVLMQFDHMPSAAERAALENAGVQLLAYVPDNTWFVSMPADLNLPDSTALDTVRWVGAIQPDDRTAPGLRTRSISQHAINDDDTVSLDIRFFADVTNAQATELLTRYSAIIETKIPERHRFTIRLDPQSIPALANEDAIQWITEVAPPKVIVNDGIRSRTNVNAVQDLPYGLDGTDVDLGEWDGGRVDTHPDFSGRLTVVDGAAPLSDHATHVAGTMAGDGSNSIIQGGNDRQWRGMAPAADIFSYYWDNNITDHNDAINNRGIELSQNSWGFGVSSGLGNCDQYGDYDWDAPEYDDIITGLYGNRISVIFAAGNERDDGDCGMSPIFPYLNYANIGPPSTAKNIIVVGAANSNDDSMTSFSSWGPLDDGRLKPDVVAPGCESTGEGYINSTLPGGGYGDPLWCGTSMAAPTVSGIAGLLIEQYRETFGSDPLPATLKAILVQTAVDLDDGTSYYNPGPDYASGYGRVDAQAAADLIIDQAVREDQVNHGQTETFTFDVPAATPSLKVTLAWDDEPGTVNANPALVNNLDLVLIAPDGTTTHLPWILNPANPANNATTGVDNTNNVEQVRVNNPAAGTWQVQVVGSNIPTSLQGYSLAGQLFTPGSVASGPVEYDSHTIDDDNSGNSSGNADGLVNAGETVELYVDLLNLGTVPATSVNVCLTEDSPYVNGFLYNNCSDYGDISGGGTGTNFDDFDFTVDPAAPDGHVINVTLSVNAGNGGPWVSTFDLPVVGDGPSLRLVPADQDVPLSGSNFIVNVVVDNAADLGAFEFDLVYDPTIVQVSDVILGSFLGSSGRSISEVGPAIDNTTGRTTYGAFSLGNSAGPDGKGVLASLILDPQSEGDSDLTLENYQLTNRDGDLLTTSATGGHVMVTDDIFFADVDRDGDVDIVDVQLIAGRYGCTFPNSCYDSLYDMDNDLDIDIADVQIGACYWGWPSGDFNGCYVPTITTPLASLETQQGVVSIKPIVRAVANPGDSFTATVEITGANNVGGFNFELHYDPNIVEVDNVTLGSFLDSTGGSTFLEFGPTIDNGVVEYGVASLPPLSSDGNGTLATIHLTARAVGATDLDLQSVMLVDGGGEQPQPAVEDGIASVAVPALQISKTAQPDPVTPGGRLTYTLTISNLSTISDATGVAINDEIPGGTQFAWADNGGSQVGNEVHWTGQSVGASSTLAVRFAVTVNESYAGTVVTNSVYNAFANDQDVAATGGNPVTTAVTSSKNPVIYLPLIVKSGE